MKIQLDYKQKTITLENNVSLSDFIERIQSILPDWKEWTLSTNTTLTHWVNPIVIDRVPLYPQNPWPTLPDWPTVTSGTDTCNTEQQYSVYNLQLN